MIMTIVVRPVMLEVVMIMARVVGPVMLEVVMIIARVVRAKRVAADMN